MGMRIMRILVVCTAGLLAAACSLENGAAPALTGPSGFALSVALTATPDQLPRDGSSQSTIGVEVRDASGNPVAGQRLAVSSNIGAVSTSDVVTGSDGRAVFTFTAPPSGTVGNSAVISVLPAGTDGGTATRVLIVRLTGASNTTLPTFPATPFVFTPASPQINQAVRFDATGVLDEGVVCNDACTYSWNFGDGSTGAGRIASHTFTTPRTYSVALTATDA